MKEEYREELKKEMQVAIDKLPFIPIPYLKQGVVGMERIKVGITNEATYTLHERVVEQVKNLTIVQELAHGKTPVRGAIIVDDVIQKVIGFDELNRSDGTMSEEVMFFATLGLLIAFSACSRFEVPSKRLPAEIRKV